MTDDFLTDAWVKDHQRFSDQLASGIAALIATVRVSLDRLNRYEFDAPWLRDQHRNPSA